MLIINSKEKEKDIKDLISKVEKIRGRKLFCLCQGIGESINSELWAKVYVALEELGKIDKLSILINSGGGDIHYAFRIVNAFYRYTENFEAIIALWAKSAATFFCLGAKKMLMSKDAELGPLDAQLPNPYGGSEPLSAINVFKSLEYLRRYAVETLDQIVLLYMIKASMDVPYALKEARYFVSDIINPLYSQVNPMELGDSGRKLAVAEEYSKIIMKRYSYSNLSELEIDSIAKRLVWDYPSHNFIIDLTEAKKIGLKVETLDDKCTKFCKDIIRISNGCFGFVK